MRYLVFAYNVYYPGGGWEDSIGAADDLGAAQLLARTSIQEGESDRAHIVDTRTLQMVYQFHNGLYGTADGEFVPER